MALKTLSAASVSFRKGCVPSCSLSNSPASGLLLRADAPRPRPPCMPGKGSCSGWTEVGASIQDFPKIAACCSTRPTSQEHPSCNPSLKALTQGAESRGPGHALFKEPKHREDRQVRDAMAQQAYCSKAMWWRSTEGLADLVCFLSCLHALLGLSLGLGQPQGDCIGISAEAIHWRGALLIQ